jgi:hypothetical protein
MAWKRVPHALHAHALSRLPRASPPPHRWHVPEAASLPRIVRSSCSASRCSAASLDAISAFVFGPTTEEAMVPGRYDERREDPPSDASSRALWADEGEGKERGCGRFGKVEKVERV